MPALHKALELLEAPRSRRPSPNEPLPSGVLILLRIVAADKQAVATASELTGVSSQRLREAAGFYIEQVLFAAGSDPYRVLGVDSNAPDEQVKEHHRWLLRWLHPDRNPDEWEAVFAERVNRAWQDLRTPDRRRELDRRLGETITSGESHALGFPMRPAAAVGTSTLAPVVTSLRWLSNLVFAGLAVSAVAALGILYALHVAESRTVPTELARESTPNIEPELSLAPVEPVLAKAEPAAELRPAPIPAAVSAAVAQSTPVPVAAAPPSPMPQPRAPLHRPAAPAPARVPVPMRISERLIKPGTTPPVRSAPSFAARPPSLTATIADSASSAAEEPRVIGPAASESGGNIAPGRSALDDRAANEMLAIFAQIYRDGDLGRLDDLLTQDAQSARSGRKGIVAEYARLFSSSERRSLNVSNVSWVGQANTATIIASFEASIWQRRSSSPRRLHGDLRLDLRMDQGRWRIFRLMHEERRG